MSYVFYCYNSTISECFERALFGLVKSYLGEAKKVRTGDLLFLHNLNTKELIGPFKASSIGEEYIEKDAWEDIGASFPAQVRVEWETLRLITNADKIFSFLTEYRKKCKLNNETTISILLTFLDSPIVDESRYYSFP